MAHLALTDVDAGRFHARDRWARAALDLAGATAIPVRVWLGDWTAEGRAPDGLPIRLRAGEGDLRIDLTLAAAKPAVLHGERGLSRKSAEPGNASYYYSLTRMPAAGEVRVDGPRVPGRGPAWMDREWSTSALGPDLVGWDWFALQLDDGRELMLYRLRRQRRGHRPGQPGHPGRRRRRRADPRPGRGRGADARSLDEPAGRHPVSGPLAAPRSLARGST